MSLPKHEELCPINQTAPIPGKKSGYEMLSKYSSTTKNFIHNDMWIDDIKL